MDEAVHHQSPSGVGIEIGDTEPAIGHSTQKILQGMAEFNRSVLFHPFLQLFAAETVQVGVGNGVFDAKLVLHGSLLIKHIEYRIGYRGEKTASFSQNPIAVSVHGLHFVNETGGGWIENHVECCILETRKVPHVSTHQRK